MGILALSLLLQDLRKNKSSEIKGLGLHDGSYTETVSGD